MAKESMSCVDQPSDGLILQICRIQMLRCCVMIRIIMEMIYGNNKHNYAACRIGHTAVRLGGLAAVVVDGQSRTEFRSASFGSGGAYMS